jgi:hypothetical protein
MKIYVNKVLLVWISLILISCNSQVLITSTPIHETPRITFAPSSTPTFIPTVTVVPELTITPTFVPTLSAQSREDALRHILQDDVTCKSPCFLGIVPDKTTSLELENVVFHYGIPMTHSEEKSTYSINPLLHDNFPPHALFFTENDMVKSTKIYIDPSNQFEWSMYSPTALLKRYGIPSRVNFNLGGIHEPSDTPQNGWYGMRIYYDDLDFIIEYGDAEAKLGKSITVCPNKDQFDSARVWLGKNPDNPPLDSTPLEQATSFTLEKFTDYLLLGSGACFELNGENIPID